MVTFLFWNLGKKRLEETVSHIALRYEVDIIMLAECPSSPINLLEKLNESGEASYNYAPSFKENKINIFVRFKDNYIISKFDNSRWTIRHLTLPSRIDILLVAAHLPSQRDFDEVEDRLMECQNLAHDIESCENDVGHSRTILVGDLNMNPFEAGVITAGGLHAVMTRSIAREGRRTIQNMEYRYFYNPMWAFFGDNTRCPPGSYYYRKAKPKLLFWNIFDQVLVRPDLLDRFKNEDLIILDSDGERSLLSRKGYPSASDHLPIIFKLDL